MLQNYGPCAPHPPLGGGMAEAWLRNGGDLAEAPLRNQEENEQAQRLVDHQNHGRSPAAVLRRPSVRAGVRIETRVKGRVGSLFVFSFLYH